MPIMIGSLTALLWFNNEVYFKKNLSSRWFVPLISLTLCCIQIIVPGISQYLIYVAQPIGIALLLLWMCYNQQSILVKIFNWTPIAFVGRISYGLYVFQGLFLLTGPIGKLGIQQFPLNIILTVVVSIASYYLLEKPVLRYKDRFKPTLAVTLAN